MFSTNTLHFFLGVTINLLCLLFCLSCFTTSHLIPRCLLSFAVAHVRGRKPYLFFFPALVDLLLYLLKLTREHPSLFPAAIMPTWPLKHIKNPAGDRETVGSVLYFLRLHLQPPLWHRHVCLPQGIESGGGRGDISWDILLTQTILWLTNKSSPHFTVYQWKSIIVLLALPSPAEVLR